MKPLFYSDYLEGAHPAILEALRRSNFEQTPGYGEDAHCAAAASLIRKACGRPEVDVHFLTGGTQTNATVIASILKPYQGVLCADSGHINVHETGAVEHGGHKVLALPAEDGKISAAQVREAIEGHRADANHEHMVMPGAVYISFPTELGTLYSKEELEDLHSVCSGLGVPLFIDGARLGYGLTSAECGLRLEDIASLADIFYIGGTKQGALFGEAVVICNPSLKADFRYSIKQNGGMLAKGRLLGIQFETLFTDGLYFEIARHANVQAARIRDAAREAGIPLFGGSSTNQVFLTLPDEALPRLDALIGFEFWQRYDDSRSVIRICTSWATPDSSVEILIGALRGLSL